MPFRVLIFGQERNIENDLVKIGGCSSSIHKLYRPKAQSGEDNMRGSQPTLDLDARILENQIRYAAVSQIAYVSNPLT